MANKDECLHNLVLILESFSLVSGLKINLNKSMVVGLNINENRILQVAEILGCAYGSWPLSYLGLPLGGNPNSEEFWNPVIEKISKRVEGWYKGCLSRGGRLVLLQAVLGSMPLYYLSLFKIPAKKAQVIEKIMRDFFWKGKGEGHGDNLVNWETVSKSKRCGGLGVGNITSKNVALLGKWLWRFPLEFNSLWHKIIVSKFGVGPNGWDSNIDLKCSLRSPWKAIVKGWSSFACNVKIRVGCGDRTRFWIDCWLGNQSLKDLFPRLFQLSLNKNALIKDVLNWESSSVFSWNLSFVRGFNDREVDRVAALMEQINNAVLRRDEGDKRIWLGDNSGFFSCKSFFDILSHDSGGSSFPQFNFIWKNGIPTKIKIFGWLAVHRKVNTSDRIQARYTHSSLSPSWCVLCKEADENIDHILIHCRYSQKIWNCLFKAFGLTGAVPYRWADLIQFNWSFGRNYNKIKKIWRFSVMAFAWQIWLERNRRIFEDKEKHPEILWSCIISAVRVWARASNIFDHADSFLFSLDSNSFLLNV